MLKWKSTGPRRHSGNIILLPLILDHFQFQHPLSSPYAAKSQKGDVIWSCLTNFMSKTLLKSISSFFIWNSTAFIQWIPLTWTNTTTSKLVSLTPVYPLPRPWIYPHTCILHIAAGVTCVKHTCDPLTPKFWMVSNSSINSFNKSPMPQPCGNNGKQNIHIFAFLKFPFMWTRQAIIRHLYKERRKESKAGGGKV